jgi:hypothetical protein
MALTLIAAATRWFPIAASIRPMTTAFAPKALSRWAGMAADRKSDDCELPGFRF